MIKAISYLFLGYIVLFSGCAATTNNKQVNINPFTEKPTKPVDFNKNIVIKNSCARNDVVPLLRENNRAQRAVVDMGVVLKTTIKAYKDRNHNLYPSHVVYHWGRKPDFIVSNSIPLKNRYKQIRENYIPLPMNIEKRGLVDMPRNYDDEINRIKSLPKRYKHKRRVIKKRNSGYDKRDAVIRDFIKN